MDEFNTNNEINNQSSGLTDDILYDAVDREYEIKLAKMKTRNKILTLITLIIMSVTVITTVFMLTNENRAVPKKDKDEETVPTDTEFDAPTNTHFAPKFDDYQIFNIVQHSNSDKTKLTPTEVYNNCIDSSVVIYSYDGNQIKVPDGFATGTVLSEDGFIITNHHVVDGFTNFTVKTAQGKEFEAILVGADEKTDLAVIKVDGAVFKPADFGYVSEMKVGETIYAIGNPSGLIGSITTGIVSSLSRTISSLDPYTIDHLQIDAAVNTGNSGGPLVNEYGQVVGIIDAKYVANYAEGIGFAISMDEAKPIIEDIIKNGKVTGRVRLGISYTTVTEENAELTGDEAGMHVSSIAKNLPISKTDLKVGDIIIDINGFDVSRQEEFRKAIRQMQVGDSITMTVSRNGKTFTVTTEVGEYEE